MATSDRAATIIEAYEKWDPERPVEELLDTLNISRARLYAVLNKNGVTPKTRRGPNRPNRKADKHTVDVLLRKLVEAETELEEYRDKYGPL